MCSVAIIRFKISYMINLIKKVLIYLFNLAQVLGEYHDLNNKAIT